MFFCLRSRSRRAKLKFRSSYRERTVPSQFLRGIICRRRLLRRLCLRSLIPLPSRRAVEPLNYIVASFFTLSIPLPSRRAVEPLTHMTLSFLTLSRPLPSRRVVEPLNYMPLSLFTLSIPLPSGRAASNYRLQKVALYSVVAPIQGCTLLDGADQIYNRTEYHPYIGTSLFHNV